MKVEKITSEMLLSLIKEEAEKIKQEIFQEGDVTKVGEPLDVKLNKNDGTEDKDAALVHKSKSKTEYKKGPATVVKSGNTSEGDPVEDVKLNQQPSKGGSDEKAATAVKVKAGAEKGGKGVTAGQAKANFESKSEGPKKSVSDPFVENGKENMNEMDKLIDDGTKTFVEAGAEKGGTDVTAGQHKAGWKESAPKSDNDKRIATGIQLKESYTKTELRDMIIAEAKKIASKQILEQELIRLKEELKNI